MAGAKKDNQDSAEPEGVDDVAKIKVANPGTRFPGGTAPAYRKAP